MIKTLSLSLCVALGITAIFYGCTNEIDPGAMVANKTNAQLKSEIQEDFAASLAKAMQEKEIRKLIKKASLEKLDGDFDVLYAYVKDRRVADGRTFTEVLSSYSGKALSGQWERHFPLLTIYIPELEGFSAEDWNVSDQIPAVAIYDPKYSKEKVRILSQNEDPYEQLIKIVPRLPVVVVKENERIVARLKTAPSQITNDLVQTMSTEEVFRDGENIFYHIGNPQSKPRAHDRYASQNEVAPMVINAYNYNAQYHRDWIYYHIAPNLGYNSGTLANYTERLRGVKFADPYYMQLFAEENWIEGQLEFHVHLLLLNRNGGIVTFPRTFSCQLSQLMSFNPTTGYTAIEYHPDVDFIGWNLYTYGSHYKYAIMEFDPGDLKESPGFVNSYFGSNFPSGNASTKTGIFLGTPLPNGPGVFEQSAFFTLPLSENSWGLGTVTVFFPNNVIIASGFGIDPARPYIYSYETQPLNSGPLFLSIEPVPVGVDTRPLCCGGPLTRH
ncbi:hypothetical protein LZD49_32250 [Dyadobacter sp. CY261]|uniref:hypothetical protein n=1 Tax=Dyadobacter sp. CY261 TaxID=2907203 RepID=UPI001F2B92C7|nr:hypothetical protein [Dyadobacter sp. CY261]MCF0075199.1 hypothetical protein [Dyadobacter sp. CY261]